MLTGYAAGDEALIIINPTLLSGDWSNYNVIAEGRISVNQPSASRDLGIVVKYVDASNFYWVGLGLWGHQYSISRCLNGVYSELASAGLDSALVLGQTYRLKVVANSNGLIELWVGVGANSTPVKVLEFTDTSISSGSVGFRAFDTMVEWDFVDVAENTVPVYYTLTVGSNITLNPAGGTYLQGTTVEATANAPANMQFSNWTGDASGTINPTAIVMDRNKSIQAVFTPIVVPYTLTISSVGNGHTSPAGTQQYSEGTSVPVSAIADSGNYLVGWTLDGLSVGTDNPVHVTMNSNHTLVATFAPIVNNFMLTINGSLYGTTNPIAGTYQFAQNQSVSLSATPIAGYVFSHWLKDGVDVGKINVIVMDASYTLTPVFVQSEGFNWIPILVGISAAVGTWYVVK